MNAPTTQPVSAWLGEFLLLAALWGASFLFMRLGASEFGPLPTAGLRVALPPLNNAARSATNALSMSGGILANRTAADSGWNTRLTAC